ncbi:MAG: hypothetical protein IPH96_17685 [Saprospiraceae bacterium]|nr:hypothetical protein [Saprospiraceae bacterium]
MGVQHLVKFLLVKESYIYVVRTDLASGKQLLRYSVSQMGNPGYMPTIINSNLPGTLGIDFAYNCAGELALVVAPMEEDLKLVHMLPMLVVLNMQVYNIIQPPGTIL